MVDPATKVVPRPTGVSTVPETGLPEFEAALAEAVKERDFLSFQPWRLGRSEPRIAWTARTVDRLAGEHGVGKDLVHDRLAAVLAARIAENDRKILRRTPALCRFFYHHVLKRFVVRHIYQPMLRRRILGNEVERTRTDFRLPPAATAGCCTPMASIVVLSFNRLAYLRSTLESLFAATPRNAFELIVVDNGSTDGSAEALRKLADRGAVDKLILSQRNRGVSAGINVGFAYAEPSSRYLIKLDSDIKLLTPGWLARFETFFEKVPEAGILALYQVNHPRLRVASRDRVAGEKVISWNWWPVGSACMTIPRSVFDQIGHFCEDFTVKYAWDDVDYAKRVFLLGRRAYYLCGTRSFHRFDLDGNHKELREQKRRELPVGEAMHQEICREYKIGSRDIRVFYPQYENCEFPKGERVIEIE